jgi:hypothetical protein
MGKAKEYKQRLTTGIQELERYLAVCKELVTRIQMYRGDIDKYISALDAAIQRGEVEANRRDELLKPGLKSKECTKAFLNYEAAMDNWTAFLDKLGPALTGTSGAEYRFREALLGFKSYLDAKPKWRMSESRKILAEIETRFKGIQIVHADLKKYEQGLRTELRA